MVKRKLAPLGRSELPICRSGCDNTNSMDNRRAALGVEGNLVLMRQVRVRTSFVSAGIDLFGDRMAISCFENKRKLLPTNTCLRTGGESSTHSRGVRDILALLGYNGEPTCSGESVLT